MAIFQKYTYFFIDYQQQEFSSEAQFCVISWQNCISKPGHFSLPNTR